jgi:CxxC motif-containing protein (DUF1111 family)
MSTLLFHRGSFPFVFLTVALSTLAAAVSGQEPSPNVEQGRELFSHKWERFDALSPSGDGLGPMHNATSCVECHHQGGIGGAGANNKNVDLLAVAPKSKSARGFFANRRRAAQIHPAFQTGSNLVLHKASTSPGYDVLRLRLLGEEVRDKQSLEEKAEVEARWAAETLSNPQPQKFAIAGVSFQTSQRNTPALFGLSLIDSIPSEEIIAQARRQADPHFGGMVKGRAALPNPEPKLDIQTAIDFFVQGVSRKQPRVGRFGWRGQTASLREFVMGACANELGLEVATNSQAINPLGPTYRPPGVDLTTEQCDALVSFVRALPRPTQIVPTDPTEAMRVELGERLFRDIGCADCHVRKMGEVDGLYSDLLLHDMGPELADLVPANSHASFSGGSEGFSGYNGGSSGLLAGLSARDRQSWRTPPLWGVRDSAPYLHDGRAKTLRDAIKFHDGESRSAKREFYALNAAQQISLLAFLDTLVAPVESL